MNRNISKQGTMYFGLSCTGHDNSLAIVDERGEIIFAQGAERYYQVKHAFNMAPDEPRFIKKLFDRYCQNVKKIVICKTWPIDTRKRMQKEIENSISRSSSSPQLEKFMMEKANTIFLNNLNKSILPNLAIAGSGIESVAAGNGVKTEVRYYDHHLTHAAYACYTSPFESAACVVVDGYSEDDSHSLFRYQNRTLQKVELEAYGGVLNRLSASLGIYYGVLICTLCGFEPNNGEEWKIMGLAPYGKFNQKIYELLKQYICFSNDRLSLPNEHFGSTIELFEHKALFSDNFEKCADLAFTAQFYFSELMKKLLNSAYNLTNESALVLTGGCALNTSFNGKILNETSFNQTYIPPAPGDDGNAIGAAMLACSEDDKNFPPKIEFHNPYCGEEIADSDIENFVQSSKYSYFEQLPYKDLYTSVAKKLSEGKIVAWVQGRAEFGPRALGNRSILADPRSAEMKTKINAAVKYREPFRPFAPVIMDEYGSQFFECYSPSWYMEKTHVFKKEVR
ncbi:MAG: hypothetical protein OEY38_20325, partial [Gammaproteobacteria bacterium]|nr:hypothetical protein [Gammaproteobacteria bacterium]